MIFEMSVVSSDICLVKTDIGRGRGEGCFGGGGVNADKCGLLPSKHRLKS